MFIQNVVGNLKMKNLSVILLIVICITKTDAQTISANDSLYLTALEKYSIQLDSFYSKYSNNKRQYSKIYIQNTDLFKGISENIRGREVVILNNDNLKEVYKKNEWKLIQLKIFPIKIKQGEIEIKFIPYHGKMDKKGNLSLALSSWTNVYFKYDCNQKKWLYDRSENGGI